jgi:hypothetical protein
MEPPLWVKGDRGCSEKQEILTARWAVREGGVVHSNAKINITMDKDIGLGYTRKLSLSCL